jgi:hypothetical protein
LGSLRLELLRLGRGSGRWTVGARDAIDLLAAQGVYAKVHVSVEVVSELPLHAESATAGCYLESEQRVVILTFSEFEKFRTWFRIPIDAHLYRSLVAHAVARAIAAQHFRNAKPSTPAGVRGLCDDAGNRA